MNIDIQVLHSQLATLSDPMTGLAIGHKIKERDIVVENDNVKINLNLGYLMDQKEQEALKNAVRELCPNVPSIDLTIISGVKAHKVQGTLKPIATIKNIVAVASGKGGVGKSTTSVNLAIALAQAGNKVGILDADIYGPSQPLMLGVSGKPESTDGKTMNPLHAHGVSVNSIGFLINADSPAIWRGPMVTQALEQLLVQTNWPDLDYLIVDMPPGTGDIALTLSQRVPVVGAVIVTTPQDVALLDARKGLNMFRKVDVPILGVVENMSMHICSNCGHAEAIFGQEGGQKMAHELEVPFLGGLPLELKIRQQTDEGNPTVASDPESSAAQAYRKIARSVAIKVSDLPLDFSSKFPSVVAQ